MNKSITRFLQCMIALALATYLAEKWSSGRLSYYINLRFAVFTWIGIVGLAIMVIVGLNPLFGENQKYFLQKIKSDSRKRNINGIVIFLAPILVAIIGLSIPIILVAFILVFVIGLLGLYQFHKTNHDGNQQPSDIPGSALILLVIPLILGIVVPIRPLSTSSLSTRGMGLSAPSSIGEQSFKTMDIAADDRTVLDWIKIFNYEKDLSAYLGKTANVIGFVYHDPRLKDGQFMVGRFAITCCVADAFAIGMVVDWQDSATLVDNSWINVKGDVDVLNIDGQKVPAIHAKTINPIQAPEQPYLYP